MGANSEDSSNDLNSVVSVMDENKDGKINLPEFAYGCVKLGIVWPYYYYDDDMCQDGLIINNFI